MKIKLTLKDTTLTATLYDTPTARDFASLLPLTLTLDDYAKTEKVSDLPKKLTREGAPAGADPSVGDIAYYAPWGNLAMFYKDFEYSDGLILLGKLDGGAETLSVPGSVKVTIGLPGKDDPKSGGWGGATQTYGHTRCSSAQRGRPPEVKKWRGESATGLLSAFDSCGKFTPVRFSFRDRIRDLTPQRSDLKSDFVAGLTFAIVSVPQAMAHALLAAVNPVLGIYTLIIAVPVAAIFTSAVFMNVSYAESLWVRDNKLMLVGVDAAVRDQLARTGLLQKIGEENVFLVSPQLGAAMNAAAAAAQDWLGQLTASKWDQCLVAACATKARDAKFAKALAILRPYV